MELVGDAQGMASGSSIYISVEARVQVHLQTTDSGSGWQTSDGTKGQGTG